MIRTIIQSAFQTGCLSVESEGLLNQVLASKCFKTEDLEAISALCDAVTAGKIIREAGTNTAMKLPYLGNFTVAKL